jgi:hypothetical protein
MIRLKCFGESKKIKSPLTNNSDFIIGEHFYFEKENMVMLFKLKRLSNNWILRKLLLKSMMKITQRERIILEYMNVISLIFITTLNTLLVISGLF